MSDTHDLVVIGAGSAGLAAAEVATRFGVRVALVEGHHIGGDCTWTGCVPSKALLKAAKAAHTVRTAARYGVSAPPAETDMGRVRAYVREAIERVSRRETPDALRQRGIEVVRGPACFADPHTIRVGDQSLRARRIVIATGARPRVPDLPGLREVPFHTYETIFDNDRLPGHLLVIGAGPVGVELAQAYRRLGAEVTLVGERLLPRDEPEAAEALGRVFAREGIDLVQGRVSAVRRDGETSVLRVADREVRGDLLLVAVGRTPRVDGLGLETIGVKYSATDGIAVDRRLRTTVSHIYAAGDCVGGYQFTHFAGWQAFHAVRNALLPFGGAGVTDVVPWTTFTDPEVAHVGLTEAEARRRLGEGVRVTRRDGALIDRAVCEDDAEAFVKLIHRGDGALLGATIVGQRAGEAITEVALALTLGLRPRRIATTMHVYPTYSDAVQQAIGTVVADRFFGGVAGRLLRAALGAWRRLRSAARRV
ncbi:MAG TPA: FAD-dependent oxidoreductase [Methylomirabilota bacterium]|nr:FAD-dependent oxidoreductase [Methylomirabilota bacterium]